MTAKQTQLIETLYKALPANELPYFAELVEALSELGYKPHKQSVADFDLLFKHIDTKKPIAKVGLHRGNGRFRMKYSSCKDVPVRFIAALHKDDASRRALKSGKPPHNEMKNFCGLCDGDVCSSGGWGYLLKSDDGKDILRCGAYPADIPIIDEHDVADVKRLMLEQHEYLMEKWSQPKIQTNLGGKMSNICQSCAMPLENVKLGTNADGTHNQVHCEHCYKDGKYKWPAITMNGMIKSCIKHSVPHIYPDVETAKNAMNELFPTLKRWAKHEA